MHWSTLVHGYSYWSTPVPHNALTYPAGTGYSYWTTPVQHNDYFYWTTPVLYDGYSYWPTLVLATLIDLPWYWLLLLTYPSTCYSYGTTPVLHNVLTYLYPATLELHWYSTLHYGTTLAQQWLYSYWPSLIFGSALTSHYPSLKFRLFYYKDICPASGARAS